MNFEMKKGIKRMLKIVTVFLLLIIVLIIVAFINHKIRLEKEENLLSPMGEMVDVNGNKMHVYVEGEGSHTLIFMSGGGTCSPVLDFKSLYSLLSVDYRIVVIEKFGYGYSDVIDTDRQIDSILEDSRTALSNMNIEGPYVLCPHSMSGIEALYWAQKYPDEVEAIIGLDMAVPKAYENYNISMPAIRLGQFASTLGITRLIPGVAESDAIKYGTLTEEEKNIYRAIFYRRTFTTTMIAEVNAVKDNARKVGDGSVPECPMLLFVSNGQETGWDTDTWRNVQSEYVSVKENAFCVQLDCSHYIHDYKYEDIATSIMEFLK